MGKLKTPPKFGENQAGATAKFVRVPPRKARLVIDAVRGRYVTDALALLKFVPNFAARAIEDVIGSAVANAENSRPTSEASGRPLPPLIRENLKLVRAFVDEGPRMKRVQPRAQGRAYRIVKRMCHITVIVEETTPRPRPVKKPTGRRARQQAASQPTTVAAVATPTSAAPVLADPMVEIVESAPHAEPEVETAAIDTTPVDTVEAASMEVETAPTADSADDAPIETAAVAETAAAADSADDAPAEIADPSASDAE